jgi:hypothetical protein
MADQQQHRKRQQQQQRSTTSTPTRNLMGQIEVNLSLNQIDANIFTLSYSMLLLGP